MLLVLAVLGEVRQRMIIDGVIRMSRAIRRFASIYSILFCVYLTMRSATLLSAPGPATSPFSVTIDVPGATHTLASGINNRGHVVGHYYAGWTIHGFVFRPSGYVTIDVPGAGYTVAAGINDQGTIVGSYLDLGAGRTRVFVLGSGEFRSIDFPGAIGTWATSINNYGEIVGSFMDSAGRIHGFVFAGAFTQLDFPGAIVTGAQGINDSGAITGTYGDASGSSHSFLLRHNVFSTFDVSGAEETYAANINNHNLIVGYYTVAGRTHGFRLVRGGFTVIDKPEAVLTFPAAINDRALIVGAFVDQSGTVHGYLIDARSHKE